MHAKELNTDFEGVTREEKQALLSKPVDVKFKVNRKKWAIFKALANIDMVTATGLLRLLIDNYITDNQDRLI